MHKRDRCRVRKSHFEEKNLQQMYAQTRGKTANYVNYLYLDEKDFYDECDMRRK